METFLHALSQYNRLEPLPEIAMTHPAEFQYWKQRSLQWGLLATETTVKQVPNPTGLRTSALPHTSPYNEALVDSQSF